MPLACCNAMHLSSAAMAVVLSPSASSASARCRYAGAQSCLIPRAAKNRCRAAAGRPCASCSTPALRWRSQCRGCSSLAFFVAAAPAAMVPLVRQHMPMGSSTRYGRTRYVHKGGVCYMCELHRRLLMVGNDTWVEATQDMMHHKAQCTTCTGCTVTSVYSHQCVQSLMSASPLGTCTVIAPRFWLCSCHC